jgi:CoA:oxalate CoA-transferase
MLDGQIAILESAVQRYVTSGKAPQPLGNRHPSIAPFEPFETADRPIIIAAGNDTLFVRLCRALGRSELGADPRFLTNRDRLRNIDVLKTALEETLRTRASQHWLAVLDEAGVPCSPIHTVADAVEHPQVRARNMIVTAGGLRMAGNPIKLSGFPDPAVRRPAPRLDQDGERIRKEFGGEA